MRFRTAEVISTVDSFLLRTASASSVAGVKQRSVSFMALSPSRGEKGIRRLQRPPRRLRRSRALPPPVPRQYSLRCARRRGTCCGADAGRRPHASAAAQRHCDLSARVAVEQDDGHLHRSGLAQAEPMAGLAPSLSSPSRRRWPMATEVGDHVGLHARSGCVPRRLPWPGFVPRRQPGDDRSWLRPRGCARACHRCQRLAVGDRLAE